MEIDYEKAYKEALERARRIKNGEGDWRYSDLIEIGPALTEIFPGLAESEDERIRRLLVWQVHRNIEDETNDLAQSVYDGIKGHDPDLEESIEDWKKCLAYLEKQKENPKSADSIPADCASDAKCEDRWHKVGDSLPDNPREVLCKDEAGNYFIGRYYVGEGWEISNYDDEDKPHHLNPPVSKWIDFPSEKQKEQKLPITGNDFGWIDELKHDLNHPEELDEKVQEVLKKRQKPVEWNEDDDVFLNEIIDFFENGTVRLQHDLSMYAHWLKSLPERFNLQPKQEWSEEDEKILDELLDHCNTENATWYNWLKSLRPQPQWKPSEEQMEALHELLGKVPRAPELYELFNDLEKLM